MTTPVGNPYSERMVIAVRHGSLVIVAIGIIWAVVFAAIGWWVVVGLDFGMIAAGLLTYVLIQRGRYTYGLLVSQAALAVITITMGLMLDVPADGAPRVTHLYLLVLAATGYLNYQRENSRLQLLLIGLCLAAFAVLSGAPLALPNAVAMPQMLRSVGTWANILIATSMLAACIYAMQAEFNRQDKFGRDLMTAVLNSEFSLVYQPQVDLARKIIGAEALLRWTSPSRGAVSPADFIPHAERAGLMPRIGEWVLTEGCQALAEWGKHPELRRLTLSINVSAEQLRHSDFVGLVLRTLEQTGALPQQLTLELTESVMVTDMAMVVAKLDALRAMGITISLDDFGTGYSSLSYLSSMPVQQLKIDRGFVQEALNNPRSAALVENVVRIGRDLGHVVLAEGIETVEQHVRLAHNGCTQFQGYLYGKPMILADLERRVLDEANDFVVTPLRANG